MRRLPLIPALAGLLLALTATSAAPAQAAGCDGFADYRVVALHLDVQRTGHWRSATHAIDAVERDTVSAPGRDNQHPIPYSAPATFSCGRGGFQLRHIPVDSQVHGTWRDSSSLPAPVPMSGACDERHRYSGKDGYDLESLVKPRGRLASFRLKLNLESSMTCDLPDRTPYCPEGDPGGPPPPKCDPERENFYGPFDGSEHFFLGGTTDDRFLPGRAGSLSAAAAAMGRRTLTVPIAGHFTHSGRWRDLRFTGTERIDVSWSGTMTLRRYARCHQGEAVARCLPRGRP
jgi:hypothetical protein